jgi:hypothetical protein
MAGTGHIQDIEVILVDQTVEVDINEIQAGRRAPVTQQARLDVLRPERLAEKRVVLEIDLPDGQVVGGSPIRVESRELVERERLFAHDSSRVGPD